MPQRQRRNEVFLQAVLLLLCVCNLSTMCNVAQAWDVPLSDPAGRLAGMHDFLKDVKPITRNAAVEPLQGAVNIESRARHIRSALLNAYQSSHWGVLCWEIATNPRTGRLFFDVARLIPPECDVEVPPVSCVFEGGSFEVAVPQSGAQPPLMVHVMIIHDPKPGETERLLEVQEGLRAKLPEYIHEDIDVGESHRPKEIRSKIRRCYMDTFSNGRAPRSIVVAPSGRLGYDLYYGRVVKLTVLSDATEVFLLPDTETLADGA